MNKTVVIIAVTCVLVGVAGLLGVTLLTSFLAPPGDADGGAFAAMSAADRQELAAVYEQMGRLLLEDRQREPAARHFRHTSTVLERLFDVGDLVVGTGWQVGERYPDEVGKIESHFRATGITDEPGALTDNQRERIAEACDSLARMLTP